MTARRHATPANPRDLPGTTSRALVATAMVLGVIGVLTTVAGLLVAMNGGGWIPFGAGLALLCAMYAAARLADKTVWAASHGWSDEPLDAVLPQVPADEDSPWEPSKD